MQAKIKIIKKADADRRREEERRMREARAEITMLQLLIERYPERARKFLRHIDSLR